MGCNFPHHVPLHTWKHDAQFPVFHTPCKRETQETHAIILRADGSRQIVFVKFSRGNIINIQFDRSIACYG